ALTRGKLWRIRRSYSSTRIWILRRRRWIWFRARRRRRAAGEGGRACLTTRMTLGSRSITSGCDYARGCIYGGGRRGSWFWCYGLLGHGFCRRLSRQLGTLVYYNEGAYFPLDSS